MSLRRLDREAADLQRDPPETGSAGPSNGSDPYQWAGHITGPPNTIYAEEKFFFTITFPEDYPSTPFKLTFTTPISHPNISEEGEVRLAELMEQYWCPAFTVRKIMISLQVLLADPDLDDDVSDTAEESTAEKKTKENKSLEDGPAKDRFFLQNADIVRDM